MDLSGNEANRNTAEDAREFLARAFVYRPRLLRIARTRSPDYDGAEDAVSAGLLKAMDRRHQLRNPERLFPWLVRIIIRQCYDQSRSREIATEFEEELASGVSDDRLETIAAIESILDAMLAIRPRSYRDVLVYYYYRGYDYQRISETLKLPVGTIKSRMSRGRDSLLKEFRERGIKASDIDSIQNLSQWSELLNAG